MTYQVLTSEDISSKTLEVLELASIVQKMPTSENKELYLKTLNKFFDVVGVGHQPLPENYGTDISTDFVIIYAVETVNTLNDVWRTTGTDRDFYLNRAIGLFHMCMLSVTGK